MNKSAIVALILIIGIGGVAFTVRSGSGTPENSDLPFAPGIAAERDLIATMSKELASHASDHDHDVDESERPVASKTGPWPVASVETTSFNFGRMRVGERPGVHRFVIRNDGEAELVLLAGKATCQCTSFDVEKPRLAPGEATDVVISWKVESPNSKFRHGGPVYTNDPETPSINFSVEGVVDRPFEILPVGEWNAESVYKDRPGRFQGTIASRIYDKFTIKSVKASSAFVQIDVNPLSGAMLARDGWLSGYTIDVEISPDIPGGAFEDSLVIALDILDVELLVPLRARKQGTIKYLPTAGSMFDLEKMLLKLGSFAASEGKSGKLLLIVNQDGLDGPLQIVSQEATPSFVKATLEPTGETVGNTGRYFLTVEVPPGRPRVQHTMSNPGRIKLGTNHPNGEVISLDLLFSTN